MKKFILIFLLSCVGCEGAYAQTSCDEWATFTRILVQRWTNDPVFSTKSLPEAKRELDKMMGDNPEIGVGQHYLDLAYKHRNDNPVDVWKSTLDQCTRERSI